MLQLASEYPRWTNRDTYASAAGAGPKVADVLLSGALTGSLSDDVAAAAGWEDLAAVDFSARARGGSDEGAGGEKEDGDDFVDAAEAAGVDLADGDCAGREELFEHDAVLAHFACGNTDVVLF